MYIPFSKTNHDFDKTTLFIFNETDHNFAVKNGIEQKNLPPDQSHIFRLNKGEQILVGNEIIFLYEDAGYLDCEKDTFGQVSLLGGSFLKKYRVPPNIEFPMTIVPPGKGDRDNSRPATPEAL